MDGTRQRSQVEAPIVYQNRTDPLARRVEFRAMLAALGRHLYPYAVGATEKRVLDDLIRGRRLSIDGLEILCGIASRAGNPMCLEQAIGGAVLTRALHPVPTCVFEESEAEERSNAPLNEAQLLLAREKTPVRAIQVFELANVQAHQTRRLADAALLFAGKAS